MFGKSNEDKFSDILPGIKIKTLVHGEKTLMTKFIMNRGSSLPKHSHPYEQTGYLLGGKIKLTIGDDTFEVETGGSWCIDSGVAHSAEILEDSSALEIFTPPRADYIKFFSIEDIL
ncbi:MAG: cupin domain-containing protein [Spirochaetae bacterium HGW-Spirochaetae-5]|nr:MAG: cupin domain-containing protein [Spirochaetae bacterium HGW-Spirochaetae-5]